MPRFTDKTAIVTGASTGIGLAIVSRLAAEDARLVLVARGEERLSHLQAQLQAVEVAVVAGSVVDRGVAELAVTAAQDLGGVDVLVNNAGIDHTGDLLETTE